MEDILAASSFYHLTLLHDDNLICDVGDHCQIVTDKDNANLSLLL